MGDSMQDSALKGGCMVASLRTRRKAYRSVASGDDTDYCEGQQFNDPAETRRAATQDFLNLSMEHSRLLQVLVTSWCTEISVGGVQA